MARAVKSFFQAIFHAGKKTDEESDSREAFPEESSAAYASKVKLDKRRAEIARLMVRRTGAPKVRLRRVHAGAVRMGGGDGRDVGGRREGFRLRLIEFLGGAGFRAGRGGTPAE